MTARVVTSPFIRLADDRAGVYASLAPEHLIWMLHASEQVGAPFCIDAIAATLDAAISRLIARELRGVRHREDVVERARDLITDAIYNRDSAHHDLMCLDLAEGVSRRTDVARRQVARRERRFIAYDAKFCRDPTDAERAARLDLLWDCAAMFARISDSRFKEMLLHRLQGYTIKEIAFRTGSPRTVVQAFLADYLKGLKGG